MMKLSSVNHEARQQLGVSTVAYMLLEYYGLLRMSSIMPPSRTEVARDLGFTEAGILNGEKELKDFSLINEDEYGYQPAEVFYLAQLGEKVEPMTTADQVIGSFNATNATKFSARTYTKEIKYITLTMPDITVDHFEMVFEYIREKWGSDEKMKQYNTPTTILRKNNFFRYLDEAKNYYSQKLKR